MKNKGKDEGKSFWSTVPGILAAIAALITAVGGVIVGIGTLPRPNIFFPATETATIAPPPDSPATDTATAPPQEILAANPRTEPPVIEPSTFSIDWKIYSTGVCRDDTGGYPRWSEYTWTLTECQNACQNNPNCQGLAMSKQQNYCQLLGSDGQYDGTSLSSQITHGDNSYSDYTCFIKP